MDARGLALAVPVIAGEHSCGPWLVTVHPATRAADDEGTTEQILTERTQAGQERYDGVTREAVAEGLVTLRENCRGGWGWRNRDKRHTFVEYADARLALMCSIAELPPRGRHREDERPRVRLDHDRLRCLSPREARFLLDGME